MDDKVVKMFKQFDQDNSGTIEIDELENMMKSLGQDLTK